MINYFALVLLLGWVLGCAHHEIVSENTAANSYAKKAEIKSVPFIEQESHQCGPTTLAMVLNWAGKTVSAAELADQVLTPDMKGSFQQDMITAARRNGMLAIPIAGMNALFAEVSAGNPVIIFENLGLSWIPQYHYAVVLGYDLEKHEILMHSGPEKFMHTSLTKFKNDWSLEGFWGLVVLPPGLLSATANETKHIKAAAVLEQFHKLNEAKRIYQSVLSKWPSSAGAEIGLANIAYAVKDYQQAIYRLHKAIIKNPGLASAWHNLTIAQAAGNRPTEAYHSARLAYRLASPEQKIIFAKTLKEWISIK